MKLNLCFLLVFLVGYGCSTTGDFERVVSRMDGVDEKPKWATLSNIVHTKNGKMYALGVIEAGSDAKIHALSRIADNNARVEISKQVENSIDTILQNAEEGVDGTNLARFIATEVSSLKSRDISVESRYYQKVLRTDENGEKSLVTQMYSLVSIPEITLRKLIKERVANNNQISEDFKLKIDKQLDTLLN